MRDQPSIAERVRAYRRRVAAADEQEILIRLPNQMVALLDELKERHGLRNRGQAFVQLIERGRVTAQQ